MIWTKRELFGGCNSALSRWQAPGPFTTKLFSAFRLAEHLSSPGEAGSQTIYRLDRPPAAQSSA